MAFSNFERLWKLIKCKFILKDTEFIGALDQAEPKGTVIPSICNSLSYSFLYHEKEYSENVIIAGLGMCALMLAVIRVSITQNVENIMKVFKILAINFI